MGKNDSKHAKGGRVFPEGAMEKHCGEGGQLKGDGEKSCGERDAKPCLRLGRAWWSRN